MSRPSVEVVETILWGLRLAEEKLEDYPYSYWPSDFVRAQRFAEISAARLWLQDAQPAGTVAPLSEGEA